MSSIGSFNFEGYSANKSHESALFCYDKGLAKELKLDMVKDMINSTPMYAE